MGLDFLERATKTWTRGWEKEKVEAELPTLFTLTSRPLDRCFRATPENGFHFGDGQEVFVSLASDDLVVAIEGKIVGRSENVNPSLNQEIARYAGCAVGVVRSVSKRGNATIMIVH